MLRVHKLLISAGFCCLVLSACLSSEAAAGRLLPVKSASEYRLEDIDRFSREDPEKAIHLIGMFRIAYEPDTELSARLDTLERIAVENLQAAQARALDGKRWEDAASYARSLAALGLTGAGTEAGIILAAAREDLAAGNYLAAFLAAVRAHRIAPLEAEDALRFLEAAVAEKQRRTAAFFLAAAERAGALVAGDIRNYALGKDTPADMIKGVATVLVDRGYRVQNGQGYREQSLGSAFFVDSSGLLVTNYHVIATEVDPAYEGYSRMYIRMGDSSGARIRAQVLGWDKALDLALIKAEVAPEYIFSVVDRIIPAVGDTVVAIGSPVGLEQTVTSGIVSALGRRFLQIGDVMQIDAALNPGNSGGPVVDREGRLVGVAFAQVPDYPGLNFAVPAERLAAALPAMIRGGRAERPWLGLSLSETRSGAEIIYTAPYTPAAEQQLAEGASITALNGVAATAPQGGLIPLLQDLLFAGRPGELVALETLEGKRYLLHTAVRPDLPLAAAAKADTRERLTAPFFGMILEPAGGDGFFTAAYRVRKIVRGSAADEAGLSEADPVTIRAFRVDLDEGYVILDITVKRRSGGYLESYLRLTAALDSPDTL
jgi:S1-C subfamily serine protease